MLSSPICGFQRILTTRSAKILDRLSHQLTALDKPADAFKFSLKSKRLQGSASATSDSTTSEMMSIPLTPTQPVTCFRYITSPDESFLARTSEERATIAASTFSRLDSCVLDLRTQTLAALYLRDISNSLILASDVSGSVFLHNVNHSLLVLGAQQACFGLQEVVLLTD